MAVAAFTLLATTPAVNVNVGLVSWSECERNWTGHCQTEQKVEIAADMEVRVAPTKQN